MSNNTRTIIRLLESRKIERVKEFTYSKSITSINGKIKKNNNKTNVSSSNSTQ